MSYYIHVYNDGEMLTVSNPLSVLKKYCWNESEDEYFKQFFVFDSLEHATYQPTDVGELWECEVEGIQPYYGYPKLGSDEKFIKLKKNKKSTRNLWMDLPIGTKCVKRVKLIRRIIPEVKDNFFVQMWNKIKEIWK